MDKRIYNIVVSEAHQKGSYILYEWLKKNVKQQPIRVVMDKNVVYKQNKGHIGRNDLKYLVSRGFSIYKINVKQYQQVDASKLTPTLLTKNLGNVQYILCLATKPCHLENTQLIENQKKILPLSWREHFGLDNNASKIHQGDVSKSVVKHLPLHATLYRVVPHIKLGKALSFKHMTPSTLSMFKQGWTVLPDSGMLAKKKKAVISLAMMRDNPTADYILTLRYAIMDATKAEAKRVLFSYNGEKIKEVSTDSPYTRTVQLRLSKNLIKSQHGEKELIIETVPSGNFILRSLTLSISTQ